MTSEGEQRDGVMSRVEKGDGAASKAQEEDGVTFKARQGGFSKVQGGAQQQSCAHGKATHHNGIRCRAGRVGDHLHESWALSMSSIKESQLRNCLFLTTIHSSSRCLASWTRILKNFAASIFGLSLLSGW